MKVFVSGILLLVSCMPAFAVSPLDIAIANVRSSCGAISVELADMKMRAGIGTAVSAVGTVTGGVAVGAGMAKADVDSQIAHWRSVLNAMSAQDKASGVVYEEINMADLNGLSADDVVLAELENLNEKLSALEQKSKKLGNVRTGTLATSTAANIAGAVVAGTNRIKGDLQQKIDSCIASVTELSRVRMQARLDGSADDAQLANAEKIIAECGAWETVNVSSIDKRAQGATISSGVGAGLGLVGTITSATANSDNLKDDKKEQNLNKASNILAGGTTLASGAATVFNATQISAIKRAAEVADLCEGALK